MVAERIYFDNAATSWPKPEAVYDAVDRWQRDCGAAASRGAYAAAVESERIVGETRRRLARLVNLPQPERVIFAFNGTDALNIAIHGLLRPGMHVLTTAAEHNSVLRPLAVHAGDVAITEIPVPADGVVDPAAFRRSWRPETELVVLTHASNVTGALQPIAEIAAIVREREGLLLVDAAQTLGHVPLDFAATPVDLIAASGHKGLLGPLGTGLLFLGERAADRVRSFRQGGSGSKSEQPRQPPNLPERLEAGNLNLPGIVGLHASAGYVAKRGVPSLREMEVARTERLLAGLRDLPGTTLYGPAEAADRVGVVSLTLAGVDPQEAAVLLDSQFGLQVRAGLHCAPRMHAALGTLTRGGTIRLSPGCFTTDAEIDRAVDAVATLAAAFV